MTTYASLANLKSSLGITDTSKDVLLQLYLDSAESVINGFIGVDTVISSDVTERIKLKDTVVSCNGYEFIVRKRPVTAIKKVAGVDYVGTIGTDFIVENQRKIIASNITPNLLNLEFDSFEIIYTAGYATAPADIVTAEMMMASNMYLSGGSNTAYDSYAIGDEKVVFKSQKEASVVLDVLKKYKTFK